MGVVILDAGVIIGLLDAHDAHHHGARVALDRARRQGDRFVLPVSAYAEALVGPLRRGAEAANVVDAFVDALPAEVAPANREIARSAAGLRADTHLRLPDALVVATALVLGATRVITTDRGWPRLKVAVEVLAVPGFMTRPLPPDVDHRARMPDSLREPTDEEARRGVAVVYRARYFTVYRGVVERLRPGERFRMETDFGTIEISREQFEAAFPKIVASRSYGAGPPSQPGSCWYTVTGRMPGQAQPFLVAEGPR